MYFIFQFNLYIIILYPNPTKEAMEVATTTFCRWVEFN